MSNQQKYALITGGTSGIGHELAKVFAREKYNLILVARGQDDLDKCSAELSQNGIEVITLAKDLFKREDAYAVYDEVKAKGIQVDVLVNDAGQGLYGEFKDTDLDRELDIIQLNIGATVILTKLFLKDMVARNEGKILQLASIGSVLPGPFESVYHGTKAFILSFSEAIHTELKDTNVTVTALLPGVTDTDFFNKADMQESKLVQEGSMDDPAKVAQDGFDALMAGEMKVTSGLKNKAMVGMAHMMPDSTVAGNMYNQAKPVNDDEK
jgi:short-subunit dehydrogenase